MPCTWVRLPGGGVAVVKHARRAGRKIACSWCGVREGTLQCDHPTPEGGTCDLHLCRDCAVPKGRGIDWCPSHEGRT